jgi:hypothetical protein
MLWFTYYKGTFSTFVFASQNRAFMLRSVLRTLRPYIHLTQKLTARGLKLTCFSMRELPGGPRSGGEAMSEAKPGRERPRRGRVNASSNCFMFYFKKGVSLRKKSYGKEQRDR